MTRRALPSFALAALFVACAAPGPVAAPAPRPGHFALAIHGGAGVIPKDTPKDRVAEYEAALRRALELGRDRLAAGDAAIQVVEAVVRVLEDEPLFNAGRGAVFTAEGTHELDAAIMDGRDLSCGAVAGVTTVKNPIGLARLVKERTPHVLLAGLGAERFADAMQVERVDNRWFDTPARRRAFEAWQRAQAAARTAASDAANGAAPAEWRYGTVGCVALDQQGHLAAATSTGGMTGKRWGRIGDAPVVGAGCYANDATCAISCTGTGEQFLRHVVAKAVSDRMELAGESLAAAADQLVFRTLRPGDGGLIAVGRNGEIAMPFGSDGMFRGAADASGRFEVAIW